MQRLSLVDQLEVKLEIENFKVPSRMKLNQMEVIISCKIPSHFLWNRSYLLYIFYFFKWSLEAAMNYNSRVTSTIWGSWTCTMACEQICFHVCLWLTNIRLHWLWVLWCFLCVYFKIWCFVRPDIFKRAADRQTDRSLKKHFVITNQWNIVCKTQSSPPIQLSQKE